MPATQLTTRSAPTSRGTSTLSGRSAVTPGSTVRGLTPKYRSHIHSSACWMGGTTLEIATPVMCCCSMPRVASRVWMNTPHSSAVCSRRVVRRQDARRRPAS